MGRDVTAKIKTASEARFVEKQRDAESSEDEGETKESAIGRTPLFLQLAEPRVTELEE